MSQQDLSIIIRAIIDPNSKEQQRLLQTQINELAKNLKINIQIDGKSIDGISHSFSNLGEEVAKAQSKIKKFYVDSNLSSEGYKDLQSRVNEIKNSANEFSKVTVQTYKNTNNIKSAVVEYRNEMGQLVKEQLKWTQFFDEKNNTTKKVFQPVGYTIVDDIAKQQKSIDAIEKARLASEKRVRDQEKQDEEARLKAAGEWADYVRKVNSGQITRLNNNISQVDNGLKGVKSAENIDLINKEYQSLIDVFQRLQKENRVLDEEEQKWYQNELNRIRALVKEKKSLESKSPLDGTYTADDFNLDKQKVARGVQTASSQYGRLYDNSGANELLTQLNQLDHTAPNARQRIKEITEGLAQLKANASSAAHTLSNELIHNFEKMATWSIAGGLYFGAISGVTNSISTIADVEKQMAGIQQVLPQVEGDQAKLNETTNQFIDIAKRYGQSVDEVIQAGKLWGRQYKDTQTVMELVNSTTLLSVVDNLKLEEANKSLEAAMAQFGMTAKNSTEAFDYSRKIIDSWSNTAHNAMVSAKDLAEGTERSGSVAKMVGVDFDTLQGLLGTAVRNTGLSGANLGNAFKTIFGSIHSDEAISSIEKLGIQMKQVGADGVESWRPINDVLHELFIRTADTTKDMEGLTKAASGGKYQWAKFAATIGDFNTFIKDTNYSINAVGKTEEYAAVQLETLSQKFERLKQQMVGLATETGQGGLTNLLKDVVDGSINVVAGLQKIDSGFITLAASVSTFLLLVPKITAAVKSLGLIEEGFAVLTGNIPAMLAGAVGAGLLIYADTVGDATEKQNKLNEAIGEANKKAPQVADMYGRQADAIKQYAKDIQTINEEIAKASADGDTKRVQKLQEMLDGSKKAILDNMDSESAGYVQSSNYSSEAIDKVVKKLQDKKQASLDMIDAGNSEQVTVTNLVESYSELKTKLDQGIKSDEEKYRAQIDLHNVSNQIAQLVPSLVSGYDKEGNAVLKLAGNYDTLSESVKQALIQQNSQKVTETYNKQQEQMKLYENAQQTAQKLQEMMDNDNSLEGQTKNAYLTDKYNKALKDQEDARKNLTKATQDYNSAIAQQIALTDTTGYKGSNSKSTGSYGAGSDGKDVAEDTKKAAEAAKKAAQEAATAYKNEEDHLQKLYELKIKNNEADIASVEYQMSQAKKGSQEKITLIQKEIDLKQQRIKLLQEEKTREDAVAKTNPAPISDSTDSTSTTTASSTYSGKLADAINKASSTFGIDANLIAGMIQQESSFRNLGPNKAGATGYMQLTPDAWHDFGSGNIYNAYDNIMGGTKEFATYLKKYGDIKTALAAYNWGPGNVDKKGLGNMPDETKDYIPKVLRYYKQFSGGKEIPNVDTSAISKDISTYVKVADEAALKSAGFDDQIVKLQQDIAKLSWDAVTESLTAYDEANQQLDKDMEANKSHLFQYQDDSKQYRDELSRQLPLMKQKQDNLHKEADAIRATIKANEEGKISLSPDQIDQLNKKLQELGISWWNVADAIKQNDKAIRDSNIKSLNKPLEDINYNLDLSQKRLSLYNEDSKEYNSELTNQISILENKLKVDNENIKKFQDLRDAQIKGTDAWKDYNAQLQDTTKNALETQDSLKQIQTNLYSQISSILSDQESKYLDYLKNQHSQAEQLLQNNIDGMSQQYDDRIKALQDKLTAIDQQNSQQDNSSQLGDYNKQLNAAYNDTRYSKITTDGKEVLTYNQQAVDDVKKQRDNLVKEMNRNDIKQAIQDDIKRIQDEKDSVVKSMQDQLQQMKDNHQKQEDEQKKLWDNLIESAKNGTLKYDKLMTPWYTSALSQITSYASGVWAQANRIKAAYDMMANFGGSIPSSTSYSNSNSSTTPPQGTTTPVNSSSSSGVTISQTSNGWTDSNGKSYSNLSDALHAVGAKGYDTGGYTGDFGSEGKLAFLHEKELVLNKIDTSNILKAVNLVRNLPNLIMPNLTGLFQGKTSTVDQSKHYHISGVTVQANDGMEFLNSLNWLIKSQTT